MLKMIFKVETILDSRHVKNRLQYFIKWIGYSDSDNSWELLSNIPACGLVREFHRRNPNKYSLYPWIHRYYCCSESTIVVPDYRRTRVPTVLSLSPDVARCIYRQYDSIIVTVHLRRETDLLGDQSASKSWSIILKTYNIHNNPQYAFQTFLTTL